MGEEEVRIAFGPIGAVGLALLALGIVRRSSPTAAAGAVAVMADLTVPTLRGFAHLVRTK